MKNKKGFTLVELLAVIVLLGLIITVSATALIRSFNSGKDKTKFEAAREIVNNAEAYVATGGQLDEDSCVSISKLVEAGYLEEDLMNPRINKRQWSSNEQNETKVCRDLSAELQDKYKVQTLETGEKGYTFDGFKYIFSSSNSSSYEETETEESEVEQETGSSDEGVIDEE